MLRVRRKDDPEEKIQKGTVYEDAMICINFLKQIVEIWNGAYWEEYKFDEFKTISYWNE